MKQDTGSMSRQTQEMTQLLCTQAAETLEELGSWLQAGAGSKVGRQWGQLGRGGSKRRTGSEVVAGASGQEILNREDEKDDDK